MDNVSEINMIFGERPSGFTAIAKGLWNRRFVSQSRNHPAEISATIRNIKPAFSHVRAFDRICRLPDTGFFHPLYPLTYVYPLIVRVLMHKKSGCDIFKSLNVRSWIHQHRKVRTDEPLTFHCRIAERRIVEKGMELDLKGTVSVDNSMVWECCYTFYVRGRFGEPTEVHGDKSLTEIQGPQIRGEWFLKKEDRFRFAGISGDTNGIHYWDRWARMLGFKMSFAQPVLVLGRSHGAMPLTDMDSFVFEQRLKGPVYYNSRVIIKGGSQPNAGDRYDIYCEDNPKPCICCLIRRVS